MTRPTHTHTGRSRSKRGFAIAVVVALFVALMSAAAGADEYEKLTGLDRAAQATLQGLEKSQGKAAGAPGQAHRAQGLEKNAEKPAGRERALASIRAALARGNGDGNAFGRGRPEVVLKILVGEIPAELSETNHGQKVREMVHAYNTLRKVGGVGS